MSPHLLTSPLNQITQGSRLPDSPSTIHLLLKTAGQLRKVSGPGLERKLERKTAQAILHRVNRTRAQLGAALLTWRAPRKIFHDFARILESDAKHVAIALSKRDPKVRYRHWRNWILSPKFFTDSSLTPFFDECADLILGLDERKMQRQMKRRKVPRSYRKELAYVTLTPEELFTPYRVLCAAIKKIPAAKKLTLVDLGCGWGRAGLVLLASHPRARFVGYELVEERAKGALEKVRGLPVASRFSIRVEDLSQGETIEKADYYFLFNPFNRKTLRRVFRLMRPHLAIRPKIISVRFGQPFHTLKRAEWARAKGPPLFFPGWPGKGLQIFKTSDRAASRLLAQKSR